MLFKIGKRKPFVQSSPEDWKRRWQSLVPEDCRDVPIGCGEQTITASILHNQYAVILQDGLLMEQSFFTICKCLQNSGHYVVWLMRCTQDVANGYLKLVRKQDAEGRCAWKWKSPTTNFGRWISDNFRVTILLQCEQLPDGPLADSQAPVLQRVIWAESDDATRMIPGKTHFLTVGNPASPRDFLAWLNGTSLAKLKAEK
jgi:hypothetical protein